MCRCILAIFLLAVQVARAEQIDASDPTKIYTFFGGGLKYNEYTNGEHIWEARAIGNIGLSATDMVLFEFGYGSYEGTEVAGNNTDLTNVRFRWFHLYEMNYDIDRGYRGNGLQVDMQLAGRLKGTDGQNQLHIGAMPVYAFSQHWNLYLMLNVANAWDKRFEHWNGIGPSATAQFVYSNDDWWPGAQVKLSPGYTYFVAGELEDEGSGILEINIGGQITQTIMWDITLEQNFDKDLRTFRREPSSNLENDWNAYFNVTTYF